MPSNLILLLFVFLPAALFVLAGEVIRRTRQAGKDRKLSNLLAGNVLVLLFLLSVGVLVGECYYRFAYDQTDSFGLCRTTKRWFERHYHRNLTGFRDSVNYLPMIPPQTRRVTFVGDSFTAGHGIKDVEDRFGNRVRALRPDLQVHVLSECGWDTGKELELLQYVPTTGYETDVVVLVYCLNDISDITPEWDAILDRIYHGPEPGFFATHSYLFNTLDARRRMAQEPEIENYYGFITQAYEGPIWSEQQERLRAIRQTVSDAGGSLVVVTFPFLHALGDGYPYRGVHTQLDEFWQEQDVPHLDLLPVFAEEAPADVIVNVRDVHPSEYAHELAAQAIAAFLDEQLDHLPPPRMRDPSESFGPQAPPQ